MFNIRFKKYPFSCVLIATIWYLSLLFNAPETPLDDVPLVDKWVHMVMYGGLVFVMWIDHVVRNKRKFTWAARIFMLLFAIALGGAMELVQAYLTTCRSGDWIDFEADAVGALIAKLLCVGLNKLWKEKTLDRN